MSPVRITRQQVGRHLLGLAADYQEATDSNIGSRLFKFAIESEALALRLKEIGTCYLENPNWVRDVVVLRKSSSLSYRPQKRGGK